MFKKIKFYLENRRTIDKVNKVFSLLYSIKEFENKEGLIEILKPKSEIDRLEYYIIIGFVANLNRPFTENNLLDLYNLKVNAFDDFVHIRETRGLLLELEGARAGESLAKFNMKMLSKRIAFENNKSSLGGMKLRKMFAKGRPLTVEEEFELNQASKK